MGRPKKSAIAPIKPEDESQEAPKEAPARVLESLPKDAVSQSDAARAALDKGYDKPADAVKYIKDTFGIDMNPQYFSAIKTRTKTAPVTKKAEPVKRGRKPKAAEPVAKKALVDGYVAPPEKPKSAGDPVDLIAAMEAMKPLVAALGAEKAHRIIDLLG